MGAFDWLYLTVECLACGTREEHHLQTRIAASFAKNAEGDVLALRGYRIEDKLKWHPKTDPRYYRWGEGGDTRNDNVDAADDEVQVACSSCHVKTSLLLHFESTYFVGVLESCVGRADGGPTDSCQVAQIQTAGHYRGACLSGALVADTLEALVAMIPRD